MVGFGCISGGFWLHNPSYDASLSAISPTLASWSALADDQADRRGISIDRWEQKQVERCGQREGITLGRTVRRNAVYGGFALRKEATMWWHETPISLLVDQMWAYRVVAD